MRPILLAFFTIGFLYVNAQSNLSLNIEEVTLPSAPGVHSFAVGQHDGKWLIVGGRVDGLHQRQPFAAFLASDNNVNAYVIDPVNLQSWTKSISSLPTAVFEQLQSTNMEFEQRDTVLYVIGGYGYSATAGDHITHPVLTAINIPSAIDAVINGTNLNDHVRYATDNNLAVTGGYMHQLDNVFYLVGGQFFEGRYNPMGPNHGPGFVQEYSEEIKKFNIEDDGNTLSITNYTETVDAANLHRRDYNMVPQIFPNGDNGFTVFSGVFQPTIDLPWHNSVDITAAGYTVNNSFDQMLSQYHSANLPIFDSASNQMSTLFFGGMSRYHYDEQTNLLVDDEVPFVKTISLVERAANGSMTETSLNLQMPAFLGSGAEFIPSLDAPYLTNDILNLNDLVQGQETLVGYIYGGIESSAENIFFSNDGSQSWASGRLFKVLITADESLDIEGTTITGDEVFHLETYPNPVIENVNVKLFSPYRTAGTLALIATDGKVISEQTIELDGNNTDTIELKCGDLSEGIYRVVFENGAFTKSSNILVQGKN